jgi:hypothetical protein
MRSLLIKRPMKRNPETLSRHPNNIKNMSLKLKDIRRNLTPRSRLHTLAKGSLGLSLSR